MLKFFGIAALVIAVLCIIIILNKGRFGSAKVSVAKQTPDTNIENLLKESLSDTSKAKQFYEKLLTDSVYLLIKQTDLPLGSHKLDEDLQIEVVTLPSGEIPLFTSEERILDNGIIKEEVPFVQLSGAVALKVVANRTYVVNPFSIHSCKLSPSLIESLTSTKHL